MAVRYHSRKGQLYPEYICQSAAVSKGERLCECIPGAAIDKAVGELLVSAVSPLSLEVAIQVADQLDGRAGEADALRRAAVERSRQRADIARRRYLAVDPVNRLVADTLEADWNESLRHLAADTEEYERRRDTAPGRLGEEQRAATWPWLLTSRHCGLTRPRPSANASGWFAFSSRT